MRSLYRGTGCIALPLVALVSCTARPSGDASAPALPPGEVRIPETSPKHAYLTVIPATTTTDHVVATLPAQVAANEDHTVRVASPVLGHTTTVFVRAGDVVTAGQPLASIRSADAGQARSDLAKSLATWTSTRAALSRTRDLVQHQVAAAHDLEQAQNDEAQARAEYERARARSTQLGLGGGGSDQFVLRAPIGGVVIERNINDGAEVRPDNATPLFTITSLADLWLTVNVPQRDLSLVRRGSRVHFVPDSDPGRTYDASITFVSNALDPVTRTATARAVLPNPGNALRVLTSGHAQVVTSDGTPTVVLPSRALVTHGTDTVVFIELTPGRFVRRVVVVRDDDGTTATIASGLSAGERVVVNGSLQLEAEAQHGA
jgi:cobalt-zinc-cadmium efflux system membrane fusion protein